MTENNKVDIIEILEDVDRLLTEEDLEGGVTLGDLLLESAQEEIEERVLYGNNEPMCVSDEPIDEALSRIYRGAMSTAESVNSIASAMEHMSKSGHSVADWDGDMYGVSPMIGDSPTTMHLLFTDTTEEPVRPKKRGQRCSVCSNMTKKELKKHDSCPSCGRSLFALKSRGW